MSEFKRSMEERMKKLRELKKKSEEARQSNHQEMRAEHARNKLPKNWEIRKQRAEISLEYDNLKKKAVENGEDFDRIVARNVSALDSERYEKKKKKPNTEPEYADYESATARQYQRLIKNMPAPDMAHYEKQKEEMGEAFYGDLHTMIHGLHTDRPQAIDRMVDDLNQQIAKRDKFSRRRTFNPDADVDYINERNSKFNKKLDRYYGEYTAEIKQNLERGTAI